MKKITILVAAILLGSCSWLQPKFRSGREGQMLPSFQLEGDSLVSLSSKSIDAGKPFIVFLYNPNCPYCRAETEDILKHFSEFKNTRIYLITSYPYNFIRQYAEFYHLNKYPNIILARDSTSQVLKYFNAPGVPYLAFYDGEKKLKGVLIGKNDISAIKDNALE